MKPDVPTPQDPAPLDADALIEAEIERTMRPFRPLLSAERLAIMRAILEETLREHPVADGILGQLRAHDPVKKSVERAIGGGD